MFLAFIAKEDILHDRKIRDERQFLMNNDNAFFFAIANILEFASMTIVTDLALIRSIRINTRKNGCVKSFV